MKRFSIGRKLAWVLVASLCVLLLAACGGDDEDASALAECGPEVAPVAPTAAAQEQPAAVSPTAAPVAADPVNG